MRLAFLGTPEAAVPSLRALVAAGHDVALVITRPDRRRGRGAALSPSPVKAVALELGLTVAHSLQSLAEIDVELGIVVAYGVLIKPDVLNKTPMLNVHFSLLPRWRGAAPVERAILAGDTETGVGIMSLEPTLDTGPLHAERRVAVEGKTASALTTELAEVGAGLLVEVLASPELLKNARPQVGEATYAEKLDSSTFRLIPSMSAEMALQVVRLERAWCMVAGKRLRVLRASSSDFEGNPGSVVRDGSQPGLSFEGGTLWLDEVQPEGSRAMAASAWLAGARLDDQARWS
jgi:methionyl-tRNA formyltransferase